MNNRITVFIKLNFSYRFAGIPVLQLFDCKVKTVILLQIYFFFSGNYKTAAEI